MRFVLLALLFCLPACSSRLTGTLIDAQSGTPIAGEVEVDGRPPEPTAATGSFDLPPASRSTVVTLRAPGHGPVRAYPADLRGGTIPLFAAQLRHGRIAGSDGSPVGSARLATLPLRASRYDAVPLELVGVTASDGTYSFEAYDAPAEWSVSLDGAIRGVVVSSTGKQWPPATLTLGAPGALRGTLRHDGKPVPFVTVDLLSTDLLEQSADKLHMAAAFRTTRTAADGSFSFTGLVPATYDISSIQGPFTRVYGEQQVVGPGDELEIELTR